MIKIKHMIGFTLLMITGLYAGVGFLSICIIFLGYDIMTADGKEFIVGTILPDFFFLGLLFIGVLLYGKHKTIFYGLCGGLFVLMMVTLLPRFTAAKEYIVIANESITLLPYREKSTQVTPFNSISR